MALTDIRNFQAIDERLGTAGQPTEVADHWRPSETFYLSIVGSLGPLGIPKDHVKILLREIPREDWGIRGGQAASDVELGFKIDV
jgi:hypothetical protein